MRKSNGREIRREMELCKNRKRIKIDRDKMTWIDTQMESELERGEDRYGKRCREEGRKRWR